MQRDAFEEQKPEFRRRIHSFMVERGNASPATAVLTGGGFSPAIELDGEFNGKLMLFAARAPRDFVKLVEEAAREGYAGARLEVSYKNPATALKMTFEVTCALTSTVADFAGWVVVELIRDKDPRIR